MNMTNKANNRSRTDTTLSPVEISKDRYLVVKIDSDEDKVKSILSQNAIPFKEISIFSMPESWW